MKPCKLFCGIGDLSGAARRERTITDIRDQTKTHPEIPLVDAYGGLGRVGVGLSHESAKREQVPPHFLARLLAPLTPLFVLMRGLRPTSVKHTHTLTPSSRSPTVLFVSTYRWNRLSIEASSHVWRSFWENHTPENHGPDPLTVQLWFVCMCACLSQPLLTRSPPASSRTPFTPQSWSTYVRKRAEMRMRAGTEWEWKWWCCLFHSSAQVFLIFTKHNSQGANDERP